jgi:tight adherence protein C
MTAALLGLAWAAVIAGGAVRPRGVFRRLHDLDRRVDAPPGPPSRVTVVAVAATAFVAGAAVAGLPAAIAATATAAGAARTWPRVARRRVERRRTARLEAELPEVVDLLVLAVGAGLNVPLALDAVSRCAAGELARELATVVDATRRGHRLADALDALPQRAGEPCRPLVAALVASERYGAPLAPSLERLADEVRAARRRRADIAARQVSVKLLFPLVLCILPAFALLTVAPLIASALRSLRL